MKHSVKILGLLTILCLVDKLNAAQFSSERVKKIVASMTLDEKIGQMTQVNTSAIQDNLELISEFGFGSVLSAAGSEGPYNKGDAGAWRDMIDEFQNKSKIPILYGIDAVHGNASIPRATVFPHNIGLGATNDSELLRKIGVATAKEIKHTGVHWNFAPALSVARDVRWGRIYESFSENPKKVSRLSSAYIEGLQSEGIMACAKHFVGDGGTGWGTTDGIRNGTLWESYKLDQGNTSGNDKKLKSVHLYPYYAAIDANVHSVMVSYSSWNGKKMHGHKELINEILKEDMGFNGIVVSDYLGIFMLNEGSHEDQVARSINAGIDMAMAGHQYLRFITIMKKLVEEGRISIARIDNAVERILNVKEKLGLLDGIFDNESELDSGSGSVASQEHLELAIEAAEKSAVLLKNKNNVLPIRNSRTNPILVMGEGADHKGLQSGGWTLKHQGIEDKYRANYFISGSTILDGLYNQGLNVQYVQAGEMNHSDTKYDTAIVVISEKPYAEGMGDNQDPRISEEDYRLVKSAKQFAEKTVLIIISGRPINITPILDLSDSIVAAWLPGSGAEGIANLITGKAEFTGTLPFAWPSFEDYDGYNSLKKRKQILYPYGHSASKEKGLKKFTRAIPTLFPVR